MLRDFLLAHRDEIVHRSRDLFLERSKPKPTRSELTLGIPILIDQLVDSLGREKREVPDEKIATVATDYGGHLFDLGFTVSQVVSGYGSVCEVVTKLAAHLGVEITASEFEILNQILDVAIANAVTGYERQRDHEASRKEKRIGVLAHELRNALATAAMCLDVIKKGTVGIRGRTAEVLDKSVVRMRNLIDDALAEVRLKADSSPIPERFRLAEALDQIGATAQLEAEGLGVELQIEVDHELEIESDRQFLISAVSNFVQNGLKYSAPKGGRVSVRGYGVDDRIRIEVEDECGGLPPGKIDEILKYISSGEHPKAELGLSIAMRAVKLVGGELHIRNMPGIGCIFFVEVPRVMTAHPHPPAAH